MVLHLIKHTGLLLIKIGLNQIDSKIPCKVALLDVDRIITDRLPYCSLNLA